MEQNRKPRKSPAGKILLAVLIAGILAAAVAAGVMARSGDSPSEGTTPSAPSTTASEPGAAREPAGEPDASAPAETAAAPGDETAGQELLTGYELDTPLGRIVYPREYEEFLQVEQATEGETYRAEFRCVLSDRSEPLFTLSVGPEGTGVRIGELDGTAVWLDVPAAENRSEWAGEDAERFIAMQERVNDILDQIYHLEGFHQEKAQ